MALIVPLPGSTPSVPASAWVAPNATLVGAVTLAENSSVFYGAVLRADVDSITLGTGSNIQDNVVVHCDAGKPTSIGANVSVGHGAVLHGCVVRRGALVGMNAVVMDEAEVGAQAIVAACAFVPAGMRVPPRSLVAGLPAKLRRKLSDDEIAWKHEGTLTYQDLTRRCLATMVEVAPLPAAEAGRPRVQTSAVKSLIATRRG